MYTLFSDPRLCIGWTTEGLFAATKGHCYYCGKVTEPKDQTPDHVIPSSQGGDDTIMNVVPACRSCNGTKSAGTPEQLRERLARRNGKMYFTPEQVGYLLAHGFVFPPEYKYLFWFEKQKRIKLVPVWTPSFLRVVKLWGRYQRFCNFVLNKQADQMKEHMNRAD